MRIGIDFDNTIADYDDVFPVAARGVGLLRQDFAGGKQAVKTALLETADGEQKWMRLQGKVYGAFMAHARVIDGFDEFVVRGAKAGAEIFIISHKTEYGHFDEERVNLRDAATRWMVAHGFFDRLGLTRDRVFFETTRDDKIARIKDMACEHFVDDLEAVFREPAFPRAVRRYLLSREPGPLPEGPFEAHRSWSEIRDAILH
jgi:hypothetical protein